MATLEDPDSYELIGLENGAVLRTHGLRQCFGERCVIHNPTNHHMRDWPLAIRADKQFLAERTCPHGIEHPDPDSFDYFVRSGMGEYMGLHTCDRCCNPEHFKENQ